MSLKNKLKIFIIATVIILFVFYSKFISVENCNEIFKRVIHNALIMQNMKYNIHFVNVNHSILSKSNCFIMSNHTNGVDFMILHDIFTSNTDASIHAIVKHDLVGNNIDKTFIQKLLSYIKNSFYSAFNFIPYERENRESGIVVQNQIVDIVKNIKTNIIIFPEGQCSRSGIPTKFKHGSFILAADNNIGIIPVSIKYKINIGKDRKDPDNVNDWFDNTIDVYIYDVVYNSDPKKLESIVFDKIREKLI